MTNTDIIPMRLAGLPYSDIGKDNFQTQTQTDNIVNIDKI